MHGAPQSSHAGSTPARASPTVLARDQADSKPAQLELPLDSAPDAMRDHGLRAAHPRPLVSLGKREGRPFRSYRVSPRSAWRFPEVEYGNAGSAVAALVVDCDDPPAWRRGIAELPDPNWIVRRIANDHAHIVWALAKPVHRYPAARLEPLRYLAGIEEYISATLGADPGYAGVLAHNPAMRRASPFETLWGASKPYTLDQLASVIPFGWQPPTVPRFPIGRNVTLFARGMEWAGRMHNADKSILAMLMAANAGFADPLPQSEVAAMARSIERYRERWKAGGWHNRRWLARQSARGKRKRKYETGREPWTLEGISRATWYRRNPGETKPTQIRARRATVRPDETTESREHHGNETAAADFLPLFAPRRED